MSAQGLPQPIATQKVQLRHVGVLTVIRCNILICGNLERQRDKEVQCLYLSNVIIFVFLHRL